MKARVFVTRLGLALADKTPMMMAFLIIELGWPSQSNIHTIFISIIVWLTRQPRTLNFWEVAVPDKVSFIQDIMASSPKMVPMSHLSVDKICLMVIPKSEIKILNLLNLDTFS